MGQIVHGSATATEAVRRAIQRSKTRRLLDVSGRSRMERTESKWCPEEHSHRAPKQLISRKYRQWEITETINNTNRSSGKG
jgi:hypothetical protein